MDVSIESVLRVHLSEVEEYDIGDDGEEDNPYFRTLTISTASGILALELSAATAASLEVVFDV